VVCRVASAGVLSYWVRAAGCSPLRPAARSTRAPTSTSGSGFSPGPVCGTLGGDARHTAATVLQMRGVPERAVMGIMGWSHSAMTVRYQPHRRDPARRGQPARRPHLAGRPGSADS